ncbi:hypothetical protein GA0070622_1448 [Micromonospora sediminicola]|uniref:Uncharacterized protein n=1 Tax=Micromonospora sediminicola TaxID=946078 RepID=A0A1A9B6F4_9ACTN|nr:hypothetical protein [Micromonospora sediminicola]SBT64472.1 hypothetical protein GA0070622_1448 [Micromonospora sediminicola]
MDGSTRTPPAAATVAGAVAAVAVGAYFGTRGLAVARQAGFADLVQGFPTGSLRLSGTLVALGAGALLAVVLAAVAVADRLPGWPVALAGLALDYLAGEVGLRQGAGLVPQQPPTAEGVLAVLAAVGAGLALGGALSAVARSAPARRWPVAAALAAGLVVGPGVEDLFRLAAGDGVASGGRGWSAQVGVSVLAVVVAAVLRHRESGRPVGTANADPAGPPTGEPGRRSAGRAPIGAVVATAVAAVLTLAGLMTRWWVVDVFRLSPDGLVGPRRARFVESVAYFSPVAVAVVAGLVLLGYAWRTGRATAARWVVLGFATGPLLLLGLRLGFVGERAQAYLVLLAGVAAVVAGATLARLRPGLLPWDAVGLLLAALAVPFAAPTVQAELPGTGTLVVSLPSALGLGLALGFGLVLVVTAPGADADRDPGRAAGVLALGAAAIALSALALAPTVIRGLGLGPSEGVALTVPMLVAVSALVLVLLFGFGRAVDRIRRDLRAEATTEGPRP